MVVEAERTQAEWMGRAVMRLASQASVMEVEEVEQAVAPAVETRGGLSSEVVSVASSARKVSSDTIGLSNRANRLPEGSGTGRGGGVAAESAIVKRKISAPAVWLVGTEGACDACKKAGVVAECAYGTGAACAQCKLA